MRFIRTDLLTLLVSLFILGACKNPTGVGLDIDPDLSIDAIVDTTSSITTKLTRQQDSLQANFTERSLLSYFKDPVFGTTTSNIAVAFTLPSSNLSFGKEPTLDSAVLVLPFAGFYGDSLNTNYTVEVRELDDILYNESSKIYYNNKKWNFKPQLIASKTFGPRYRDSLNIQNIIKGAKDTIKRIPAQLRIKLDPTFVTNVILKSDSLERVSSSIFASYFKGLYISLNKNTTQNNGGILSFDTFNSGASRLDLFYKNKPTSTTVDTILTSLAINGASGLAVSELTWDLSGTVVETALKNTGNNNDILYLKGFNGTQLKIDFPDLNKFKELGPNIAINRAELVLKVIGGSETPYEPLPRLRVFRWDIANRPQFIPDENPNDPRNIGQGFIGGFYNKKSKEYVFNFSGYIQDLISGKTKNYGTFITTNDFTSSRSILNQSARSIIGGGSNTTYRAKLRIYYTNLK